MTEGTRTKALSRRTILKTVGAVGVAGATGVLASRVFAPAIAGPAPKVRLAWRTSPHVIRRLASA